MQDWDQVELTEKSPTIKTYSMFERGILACFLVVVLGSFGMLVYSFIFELEVAIWITILASIFSGIGGFTFGVNRQK